MKGFRILIWAWILTGLAGCQKSEEAVEIEKEEPDPEVLFDLLPGWDIFTGAGYRYGPSIMIYEDGTLDAWFAASGGSYIFPDDPHQAVQLQPGQSLAQKFTAATNFLGVRLLIPTWNTSGSGARIRLFSWNTDYQTTIGSQPLLNQRLENVINNQELNVVLPSMASAGTYLWVMDEPVGTIGLYRVELGVNGLVCYESGYPIGGYFKAGTFQDENEVFTYWDQVAYRRSSNSGRNWAPEQMTLKPTKGTDDQLSACDPGVAKWGGYYYCGYTSTNDARGYYNAVYVARSTNPNGPWEKWDGTGWGGNPMPVVEFTDNREAFGVGEPSFVVKDDVVYLYYSWIGDPAALHTTRLSTVSATDPLWPAHLQYHGIVIDKSDMEGADHCDVKYHVKDNKFYAIHMASRFTENCYLMVWESTDGIHFTKKGEIHSDYLKPYSHNAGWSGNELGHIEEGVQQFISYAYGPEWGVWKTSWHPIRF